ncbi:MAG: hypothetical protein C5B52_09530 [Bacteroidetes bacterium]|nr:MAG: hypothetical protein C5B52_09530 [Bacteroidota bacterium]
MLKVLFLTFEFNPVQTTGNFRPAKFVKYLRDFGIDPIVICGDEKSILQYYISGKLSPALAKEIPDEIEVNRIPFSKPYKPKSKYSQFLYYSDPLYKHWSRNVYPVVDKILENDKQIRAVIVTVPPFSIGTIARKIAAKHKLPLIVDLRDAWSDQGQFPYFTRLHYYINRIFEKRLLKRADAIVAVTKELANIYEHSNPELNKDKFEIVYNNFDNYKFEAGQKIEGVSVTSVPKYIIGYIGSFYYTTEAETLKKTSWWKRKGPRKLFYYPVKEEWIYRSPYFLFKSLNLIFKKHPELRSKIFFGHIGHTPSWMQNMAKEFGIEKNIINYGFTDAGEVRKLAENFNAMLITTEKIDGNKSFCLPSKTFDYVKYNRPILALVKNGDLKDFLNKGGMSVVIDPDNLDDEIGVLEEFLLKGKTFFPDGNYINKFHSKEQTHLLADIIRKVVK